MTEPPLVTSAEPVHELRLARRGLRAERARVAWWRRVVRARIDLAVACAATPDALGEDVAFVLPLDVSLHVPRPDDLLTALAGMDPTEGVGLLPELRALDTRLAVYEAGVAAALEDATGRLVDRVASDPVTAIRTGAGLTDGARPGRG